jgi:hypothetical protein
MLLSYWASKRRHCVKLRGSGGCKKKADRVSRQKAPQGQVAKPFIYRNLRDYEEPLAANVYSAKTEDHVTAGRAAAEAEHGSEARKHQQLVKLMTHVVRVWT